MKATRNRLVPLSIAALTAGLALADGPAPAEARITRIEISRTEPAFGGQSFAPAGPYRRLIGRAFGEVDPTLAQNTVIQDIDLAPRNGRGMVEYATDIDLLTPADPGRGNGTLLFHVVNRGNKLALLTHNDGARASARELNALSNPGDGWMQRQGYTLVFFGWQADILPGDGRLTFTVPVAHKPDGSPLTGVVRAELFAWQNTATLPLSAGWFTGMTHAAYATVSLDNATPLSDGFLPTLTVRAKEPAPRVPIANADWHFGSCGDGEAVTPDATHICYRAGFEPGKLYELIYRARDPLVLGLGFAVTRDLAAFFRSADADDAGTANPLPHGPGVRTIVEGTSQSGRMIRSFVQLGFNRTETGERAFDGAFVHIGGGLLPLNVRFGQPGRAWGDQVDHLYPAYDFPFAYARMGDPMTGRVQGVLDACSQTDTCPRIFHVATALEMWEGRQSLALTDPLGRADLDAPANVRTYIMASTQHGPAALPLPTAPPFGPCQQPPDPNPQIWTMRALLTALNDWLHQGAEPPPPATPRIDNGTLVAPDRVAFPPIPANSYGGTERPAVRFLGVHDPLHVLDYGAGWRASETSGVIDIEPPRVGTATYGALVPQVDADGNDIAGIRSLFLQVPIGTYTGWNLGRAGWFEDGFCSLTGSFIPFATTRAERLATGDPRPSIEERYPTKGAYLAALRGAAGRLVAQRFLLPDDAAALIAAADAAPGIRSGP
jgi:hypothetical protein